jgi:hypothetical protein
MQFQTQSVSAGSDPFHTDGSGFGQDGLSAAIYSRRIFGTTHSCRGRRRWLPCIQDGSRSFAHLAEAFIHVDSAPQQGESIAGLVTHLIQTSRIVRWFFFRAPQNCTFTATLFAPGHIFDQLKTPPEFAGWFDSQFPDAFQLIGLENLLHDVQHNPKSPLIHIKVREPRGAIGGIHERDH